MNILVIGSGGREHAFAWKIKQSRHCGQLYVAPGNAGTSTIAQNINIAAEDFKALAQFCKETNIDLIVVGPEAALVEGIRDYFEADSALNKILMVGPGKSGARLEGSKDFSKQFMVRNGIPTGKAETFVANQLNEAHRYLDGIKPPIVLKADGLAAGKGVIICTSIEEAKDVIQEMLENKKFGEASNKVLVEEFLDGIELSVFVMTDGKNYAILPEAKDYKRIGEQDTGPNTGGMGAVSPVIFADNLFLKKVEEKVIKPTIAGLAKENIPYKGFVFIGLMNIKGEPYVIEYNARMGDPETQVVLPRIDADFVELLVATAKGELTSQPIPQKEEVAVAVVMVAEGYPESYEKGKVIHGIDKAESGIVFHAGTKSNGNDVVTNGGRVLAVTGTGASLDEASKKAYKAVSGIQWDGLYFRKDIGEDLKKWANSLS
ncbi:MAG: phosphoribosylamine--glycine ligase [Cyclobacteriaceae bacterium]|nr:phosphoribosylamine--glycine ligase [Cyclobacteriaceae bacterium]